MFNFDQPKLKLGIAYTRRDTWMNKETESNKNDIIEKKIHHRKLSQANSWLRSD